MSYKKEMMGILVLTMACCGCATSGPTGMTALMRASEQREPNKVIALIDKGADVNAKNSYGQTALTIAVIKGNADVVRTLFDKGAGVNVNDSSWQALLDVAALNGYVDVVRILLEKGAKVNGKVSSEGDRTALLAAAENGHLEVVRALVEAGADVNARRTAKKSMTFTYNSGSGSSSSTLTGGDAVSAEGHSALSYAITIKNVDMVRYLVEKGADVKAEVVYRDAYVSAPSGNPMDFRASDFHAYKEEAASILELAKSSKNPAILEIIQGRLQAQK
ncbi:MAG: ankyrin repeat domain-containing protein [Candidatus Omnitrophica bacterium]|nr:ankyrin repeat domain-containing protein [Candidatus Omnitrophota bacterium]